jgi:hypothetical protein
MFLKMEVKLRSLSPEPQKLLRQQRLFSLPVNGTRNKELFQLAARKRSKACENDRKRAKTSENDRNAHKMKLHVWRMQKIMLDHLLRLTKHKIDFSCKIKGLASAKTIKTIESAGKKGKISLLPSLTLRPLSLTTHIHHAQSTHV